MDTLRQKENYLNEIRLAASHILKGWEMLRTAGVHWTAEDLGNNLSNADLTGTIHEGLDIADFSNVIGSTLSMLDTQLVDNFHQTSLFAIETEIE